MPSFASHQAVLKDCLLFRLGFWTSDNVVMLQTAYASAQFDGEGAFSRALKRWACSFQHSQLGSGFDWQRYIARQLQWFVELLHKGGKWLACQHWWMHCHYFLNPCIRPDSSGSALLPILIESEIALHVEMSMSAVFHRTRTLFCQVGRQMRRPWMWRKVSAPLIHSTKELRILVLSTQPDLNFEVPSDE